MLNGVLFNLGANNTNATDDRGAAVPYVALAGDIVEMYPTPIVGIDDSLSSKHDSVFFRVNE